MSVSPSDGATPQRSDCAPVERPRHLHAMPTADPTPDRTEGVGAAAPGTWTTVADVVADLDATGHLDSAQTVAVPAHELRDLYKRLQSQPVIEEAKGILMGFYGVNADTAFQILRRWSQDGNIKVRVLAQTLVDAVADRLGGPVEPSELIHQLTTSTRS